MKSCLRSLFLLLTLCVASQALGVSLTPEKRKLLSKKPLIQKIIITGNQSFSEKTIRKTLSSKEDGFWQQVRLKRLNRLSKINLYKDKALLDYFYRSRGFIDAISDIDFEESPGKSGVIVQVRVDEGLRYRVGEVTTGGDLGRDGYRIQAATQRLKPREYLDYYMIDVVKQDIKTLLANAGYPYASIDATLRKSPTDSTVAISINVARNNLVVFGKVILDSTLTTKRRVFDNEIVFHRGETYSRERFYESQQRLIRTNLFSYVSLDPPDSMSQIDSLMPNLRVRAIERPPRFVNFAIGGGKDKVKDFVGDFSASVGDRSIGGTARKVRLESATSFQAFTDWQVARQRFEFTYTEPYLFSLRLPLLLSLRYEPRQPSLIQQYNIKSIALSATSTYEFSLYAKLATSFNYEQVRIFLGKVALPDSIRFRDELGITINRRLAFQFDQDTRPLQNKFNPSSGAYTSYRFEFVGGFLGGDNSFIKFIYNWSKYNIFSGDGVFASRVRFGWTREFGKSLTVPSTDRFYLGGAYTIRGFSENAFGPKTANGSIDGGSAFGLLNLELRKPLFTVGWPIWGSLFIDNGFDVTKIGRLSWRDPTVTGGAGLQVITPFGPFRVDYAQRSTINHTPGGGMFHFSILYAF
jgi:outer membrane protein insertion porin family